ncbi:hypothetical protein EVAR_19370_1 [Eumeta japonica]|uniref:Uncharacterized protein n=1 Tax=Eumeta variegata TaxID=151549 RepID=A0A4C1TRG1_EUMVA|nr:hypothetical protein EVAR_19370_1 [Eumeta japonica]
MIVCLPGLTSNLRKDCDEILQSEAGEPWRSALALPRDGERLITIVILVEVRRRRGDLVYKRRKLFRVDSCFAYAGHANTGLRPGGEFGGLEQTSERRTINRTRMTRDPLMGAMEQSVIDLIGDSVDVDRLASVAEDAKS